MLVCKRVVYTGRVQGVGFRYTAQHLARGFTVAGTVRNLSNGQVELVAEGARAEVDRFLAAVAQQMGEGIEDTKVNEEEPHGYEGFQIAH